MSDLLEHLLRLDGHYRGEGTNHEQQTFIGRLELSRIVSGAGLQLVFSATGLDGELYHEEHTLIAPGAGGGLTLVTLSNNAPGLLTLPLRGVKEGEGGETTATFGVGAPEDEGAFRMEVALDLWPQGEVAYRFAWGMPGGAFEPRSSVRMRPDSTDLAVPS